MVDLTAEIAEYTRRTQSIKQMVFDFFRQPWQSLRLKIGVWLNYKRFQEKHLPYSLCWQITALSGLAENS